MLQIVTTMLTRSKSLCCVTSPDHHLVRELGLKITDVSCKKISFAGKKLRMLGRVSFTAQCNHTSLEATLRKIKLFNQSANAGVSQKPIQKF